MTFTRTGRPTCGRRTPGCFPANDAWAGSDDPILSAFARELLDGGFQVIDLRLAKPGDGFSWGRYGPGTQVKRFGAHAVFAYQKPRSLIPRFSARLAKRAPQ